jgi:hypothetical protein
VKKSFIMILVVKIKTIMDVVWEKKNEWGKENRNA